MKLMDMKLTQKSIAEDFAAVPKEMPDYPYGLQLHLDKEQIERIPELSDMDAGTILRIEAVAKITDNSKTTRATDSVPEGKKVERDHTITIQIIEMGAVDKNSDEEGFKEATEKPEWAKYPR